MAIKVAMIEQLLFRSSEIIAHFGRNPVSGGSPPRDKRMIDVMARIIGVLFHVRESELIVVAEFIISEMSIGIVSRI